MPGGRDAILVNAMQNRPREPTRFRVRSTAQVAPMKEEECGNQVCRADPAGRWNKFLACRVVVAADEPWNHPIMICEPRIEKKKGPGWPSLMLVVASKAVIGRLWHVMICRAAYFQDERP